MVGAMRNRWDLWASGDLMVHDAQRISAFQNGQWNFDAHFELLKGLWGPDDLVMGNLETPAGGSRFEYSGYPLFNAPESFVEALKSAGWNLLSLANNHITDKGLECLLETQKNVAQHGIRSVGIRKQETQRMDWVWWENEGLKIAVFAATYGTNDVLQGEKLSPWVCSLEEMDWENQIQQARQGGADLVIALVHFGAEYRFEPDEYQIQWSQKLAKAGVDWIIGAHSHIVQPVQWWICATTGRKTLCHYSLGNFISNQRGSMKDHGILAHVQVKRKKTGFELELQDSIGVYVQRLMRPDQLWDYKLIVQSQVQAQRWIPKLLSDRIYDSLSC
jgi:poly-gamma-glutamate capsule biosynthesis protein CapA/YwtB (metallophosphatase superfamily)